MFCLLFIDTSARFAVVAHDFDGNLRVAHNATLHAQAAADAFFRIDQRLKHRMNRVALTHEGANGDGRIDEGACAIAHLAAHSLNGYAQIAIDYRASHVHLIARRHRVQRLGGTRGNARKIGAQAARLGARVNHGGSGFGARWPFHHTNRLVGTRFQTTPAFNAARAKIGFIRRPRRTKKLFAIAGEADRNATSGHSGRGDCAKRCRFHFPPPMWPKSLQIALFDRKLPAKRDGSRYIYGDDSNISSTEKRLMGTLNQPRGDGDDFA